MVPKDGGTPVTQGVGETLSLLGVVDHSRVVVEQHVVAVEDAAVLGDRVQHPAQRGPGLAVQGMGVGRGDHIWSGHVETRVDGEGRLVHGVLAVDDLAGVADQE